MENQNNTHGFNTEINPDTEDGAQSNGVLPGENAENQITDSLPFSHDLPDGEHYEGCGNECSGGELYDNPEAVCIDSEQNNNETVKKRMLSVLEFFEIFVFSIFIVLFVFSFAFRICVVDGDSMNKTLQNGEKLLTRDLFYSPEYGDIVVFYENEPLNKPLVKRVIATEGQTIEIDYTKGTVTVDGILLDEEYIYLSGGYYVLFPNYVYDKNTKIFTATIPEGMLFVMGDNRNDSWDSRSYDISFISEEQIMGKVICRISPFTTFN